jgi:uncharacterized protein (TIGR02246 family)
MKIASADRSQYVGYPTNRVVGTVADGAMAGQAVAALLAAGFRREDIDILHGEEAIHRLDLTGEEHGFLAQVQRKVIRTFELDEFKHLTDHLEDVRAGRFVIMVLAKRRDHRIVASDILHACGAASVGFYGRWAWTDLPPTGHGTPSDVAILFAQAWNARDANALASLFDEDAEFVDETGLCWHDRESIRTAHASRLQGSVDATTLATDDPKVKLISPEVAVVHARMTRSNGAGPDGVTSAPRTTIVSFVVHRAGERWLCASAHNTGLISEESNLSEPSGVKV